MQSGLCPLFEETLLARFFKGEKRETTGLAVPRIQVKTQIGMKREAVVLVFHMSHHLADVGSWQGNTPICLPEGPSTSKE